MSTPQHTPGPWNTDKGIVWPGDSAAKVIAYLNYDWRTAAETEANARLIAASPKMLAMLKKLNEGTLPQVEALERLWGHPLPESRAIITETEAIIAEAEGRAE